MSEANTQKVLAVTTKGGPLTLIRHVIWTPGEGEILVRIEGVGLNPAEWKLQTGVFDASWFNNMYPAFFGTEGAGTVVEVGKGVRYSSPPDKAFFERFKIGWITADRTTFQEYVLVEAELTAKIPQSLTAQDAATIPMGLSMATLGLCQEFPTSAGGRGGAGLKRCWEEGAEGYYSGKPILILGGASIVGQFSEFLPLTKVPFV
ncbi:chaperonin 10-like protein [Mycena polygramma]|nr:chaperonin 10-like protein [Mycena polygramma]